MKWHIITWLFIKMIDFFFPFALLVVEWPFHNKKHVYSVDTSDRKLTFSNHQFILLRNQVKMNSLERFLNETPFWASLDWTEWLMSPKLARQWGPGQPHNKQTILESKTNSFIWRVLWAGQSSFSQLL